LAKLLHEELSRLGLSDVETTENCYVLARIPATRGKEHSPAIAFMAHLDTVADVPAIGVKPQLIECYDGKKIVLADGVILDPKADAHLARQKGRSIITSDGTTLLGSDDKAGIAEAVTAAEYLLRHPEIEHGPVELIFTPDEEIGAGLAHFPKDKVQAVAAYTLDCPGKEHLEIECFNAYAVTVEFGGKVIHPGNARGILVNAALMAATFAAMLPRNESPEATDGYYGYYCVTNINGTHEKAKMDIIVRDFFKKGMERRLKAIDQWAKAVEAQFPEGKVTVKSHCSYTNMREGIEKNPGVFKVLQRAAKNLGIEYVINPIRGGTDGSALTELGVPTPNIFTGGYNFHSRAEWASVDEMALAAKLVIETISLWGETRFQ
jgi:tripeptide aminopeptidase